MFKKTHKKKIYIEGMSCGHCAKRVENKLKQLDNSKSVTVDLSNKVAIIDMKESIANETIIEEINALGYEVIDIQEI